MSESTEGDNPAAPSTAIRAITISREYGSGGGEIAARLANHLGWRLIDHEVIVEVAHRLGVTEDDAAQRDERAESFVDQILRGFRAVDPTPLSALGVPEFLVSPEAHDYTTALNETVLAAAATGQVVIVGRGAQVILHERRDTLHVRVVAPLEQRILYVAQREGLDRDSAQRRIQKKDHDRQRYLRITHERRVDDLTLYDIALNTAVLDLDSCVNLILLALERKALRVMAPPDELGPGAGVTRYTGVPADLPALVAPDSASETDQPAASESQTS